MIDGLFAIDYQVHSTCSHDGRAAIREQCRRAVELGLDEIGFSEHKDFDPADPVVDYFHYEDYRRQIEAARSEFDGALAIRMGVEIDYQKWFEEKISGYLEDHDFDFVIGSVHYVDRLMLMTDAYLAGRTVEEVYRIYFEALIDSVESGLFDILGHMEYANRRGIPACGPYHPAPYRAEVERLFSKMISKNVALEINTAGLRQGAGATYPCPEHVELYAEMGGTLLSIGSDAHHPDELAHEYEQATALALECGLKEVAVWRNRIPELRALKPGQPA